MSLSPFRIDDLRFYTPAAAAGKLQGQFRVSSTIRK